MNDCRVDGNHLPEAAQDLLGLIDVFASPPTDSCDFLVTVAYGRRIHNARGEAWIQSIFDGLIASRSRDPPLNVVFVNFVTIWNGVLEPDSGYKAFGYTNTSSCVIGDGTSIVGSCDNPEHYLYWIGG
jgi:hypothetical protein